MQWKLFQKMALPYFKEEKSARVLLFLVICFTLLNSWVSVGFSFLSRDFWNALNTKDADTFYPTLQKFAVALTGGAPIAVLYRFYREKLSLQWRQWMTLRILDMWEANRSYYDLETKGDIDNPDQRIAEDAASFTDVSLDFTIKIMTSLIDLVNFSGILYSIYPQLFGAIIAYASFGTGMTVFIGRNLVKTNFKQLQREADLRFSLVRMRENAESIAFYGGEAQEATQVAKRLGGAIDNRRLILGTQRNLEFFTVGYTYLVQILPVLVVSPLYFAGTIELGVVTQSAGAFNHVLNDLSLIVNQFEGLSSFSAGLGRLATFVERMESYCDASECAVDANATFVLRDEPRAAPARRVEATEAAAAGGAVLAIDGLRLETPDGNRELFGDLSLEVRGGDHLLVTGASGAGKSSLLRAVAGLWDRGEGSVVRPPRNETVFLPQRPYATLGSLRQQLVYPKTVAEAAARDEDLRAALETCRLGRLAASDLDTVRDWGDELSLGEQQRLAFARVLVARPRLCVLDEATSALDLANEAAMYGALAAVPGLTYVSVGHRPSLVDFHARRLDVKGGDRFEVQELAMSR